VVLQQLVGCADYLHKQKFATTCRVGSVYIRRGYLDSSYSLANGFHCVLLDELVLIR
jgi:hypothetical protein